ARRFGEIFIHPNYKGIGEDPEIVMVRREPADTGYVGEDWHADTTMSPEPPMGAILYGIDVPPYGGDTMFANQYLAYDALSDGMKSMLGGLSAVHSDIRVAGPQAGKTRAARPGIATARTGARRAARIRWCAPIPRPAAGCCS